MADHKSAIKRNRQSLKRQARNRTVRARVRTYVKKARATLDGSETGDVAAVVRSAQSELAIAARKGVLHWKNAARRASRLGRQAAKTAKSATPKA